MVLDRNVDGALDLHERARVWVGVALGLAGCGDPCLDFMGREIPAEVLHVDELDDVVTFSPSRGVLPTSVSAVGDVNGDAIADFAIRGPGDGDPRTFVVFGGADLASGSLDDAVADGRGFVIEGAANYAADHVAPRLHRGRRGSSAT